MPSKSSKQRRFMAAIAHSEEFARRVGVPQSVGREFAREDARTRVKKALLRRRRSGR